MISVWMIVLALSLAFVIMVLIGLLARARSERDKEKKLRSRPDIVIADGVRDLIEAGDLQEAARVYRDFTGVDLFSAQAAVEEIAQELDLPTQQDEDDPPSQRGRQQRR